MMDFDGKEEVMQTIEKNGTMAKKLQVLQQLMVQFAQMLPPEDAQKVLGAAQQQGLLDNVMMNMPAPGGNVRTSDSGDAITESVTQAVRGGATPV